MKKVEAQISTMAIKLTWKSAKPGFRYKRVAPVPSSNNMGGAVTQEVKRV